MDRRQAPQASNHGEIERLALRVTAEHGCHTTILYGSRARGDATPESDVDLVGVREEGPSARDARVVEGVYFDVFVYPEAALAALDSSHLRLLGGVVLQEQGGFGTALLERVKALDEKGPTPLPEDERQALTVWSHKMLVRFRGKQGAEANYRRRFLVIQALEDYFSLRGAWFRGSKEAFEWLRRNNPVGYGLFEAALSPGASDEDLASLVEAVYGSSGGAGGTESVQGR